MTIDPLVRYFETLTPQSLERLGEFYAAHAHFKDPFNDVHGLAPIGRVFEHMFAQLDAPRFMVGERVVEDQAAFLTWDFHFGVRVWGRLHRHIVHGSTHLKFGPDGKVLVHRDYWDTGEELYLKLPVLGLLMRALRRRLAA